MNKELIEYLSKCVSERRNNLFDSVLADRTKYLTIVLEDIYQSHNASAVLRSCDCFGIQDVHIIENANKYTVNPDVALGASKWLDLHYYNEQENNTLEAINKLKNDGYRIVATAPPRSVASNLYDLYDFDLTQGKVAMVFGTELTGISNIVGNNADAFVTIPMYGFTESFNISVSAALVMHYMSKKIRDLGIDWKLNNDELMEIKYSWLKKTIKSSDLIEKEFINREK